MREILGRRRRLRFRRDERDRRDRREAGTEGTEVMTSGADGTDSTGREGGTDGMGGADGMGGMGGKGGKGGKGGMEAAAAGAERTVRTPASPASRTSATARLDAALRCAAWGWPVLPGVGLRAGGTRTGGVRAGRPGAATRMAAFLRARVRVTGARPETAPGATPTAGPAVSPATVVNCACPDPECVVPGAHPFDPALLAATTDARMIRWWWSGRPDAPVLLSTGGRAPCALSLPAVAGARALAALDARGVRLGPVVATPTRWSILVAPYGLERLGELLYAKDSVPSSLRFHSDGGYLPLPPSTTGTGQVRWERAPLDDGSARPWLPDVEAVLDALVEASTSLPGGGSRLAY